MQIRNVNNTIIAAEVFSTNARSGLSAQRKICTGNTVDGSVTPLGASTINATIPIINNGAVSPSACAIPIMVPVSMPGIASGNTWCSTVCIFEAPIPSAASLIDGGTDLIAARLEIIIVGKVIRVSTKPPTNGTEAENNRRYRGQIIDIHFNKICDAVSRRKLL